MTTRTERRGAEPVPVSRAASRRASAAAVVLVVFTAVAIAAALVRSERAERDAWRGRLEATAEERKAAIEEYVDSRIRDSRVFASFPSIRRMAVERSGPVGEAEVARIHDVFETGRAEWGIVAVLLVDDEKGVLAGSGEFVEPELRAFLSRPAGERPEATILRTASGARLVFSAPVPGAGGSRTHAKLVVVDDAARPLLGLLRREPVATRTGEVYLAWPEGDRVAFLSPLRARLPGAPPLEVPVAEASVPAREALAGREGYVDSVGHRGKRTLAAVRHLARPGWGLVVKVDAEEAWAGLAWNRAFAAATFLALCVSLLTVVRAIRARERLAASEERGRRDERHRAVLEQVRDAVIWVRPADGRIVEANRAAEELWGFPRAELLARTVHDLRAPEDRGSVGPELDRARAEGVRFRTRHLRRDGSAFPVEVSARPVVLDGEELVVSVVRDVSESEGALSRMRLLNRLLRTVKAVDEALVAARERPAVLGTACREIVGTGGFEVAWFAAPDDSGRLVPEARAGRDDGFFEEAGGALPAGAGGRSVASRAFQEGRTVVVDDWRTDPLVAPVRELGLRRGYRSSAVTPVRSGRGPEGVLGIYSTEPGAFGPDAVVLLEELARDVGLALDLADAEDRRLRAESSLAESEARYRKLFDENPAPMWVFDVATLRFLAVNEAATALYGFSREEFLGMTLRDIRPPEDAALLESDVLVPRTGIRRSGPWRHRRKDGGERMVEIVTYDVVFDGRPARLTLANDVTEKLKAEEKLRAFFESGISGAIFADVHGNVFAANDEFLRIVGYSRDDLGSGRLRWTEITPPEWLPRDAAGIAEAKERGVCTPYEKEYVRKDGTRVPVLVGYALVGEARDESVAFVLDLTARMEAEARLEETTRLLRAVVDGAPVPIFTLDSAGVVTSWNPAAERVFGWTAEEAVGRTLPIVPPSAEAQFRGFVAEVAVAGGSFSGREVRRLRKDGTLIDVSIAAAPLRGPSGEVRGLAAVLSDVSARVRAEEEIRRLNAGLEERVERRTEELVAKTKELEGFAYSISHDLRAPLRAIDGFSRLVEEEHAAGLDEEGRRLLGVVRANARRMGQLIDDLLAFSRAGRHELRRSRVDVGALVSAVLEEVLPAEERPRSDVVVGDLPHALADPALLRQVFVNLLSNAVKFSATRPRRRLEVSGRRENGRASFTVEDNGVGFDMRYAGKLFGVFQRLHGREFEGTGVGLALAERIVSRHGGAIEAWSEVGRGARFTVSLPDEGGEE